MSQCFQGRLRVEAQDVVVRTDFGDAGVAPDTRVDHVPFWLLALDLPPVPVFHEEAIPQVPLAQLLAKYDGVSVQEAQGKMRRYRLTDLPPYLILHVRRFTRNRFVEERNATTVSFPTEGLDVGAVADVGPPLAHVYDLLANVTHDALAGTVRERSVWRCQVHKRGPGGARWFQMQDLHVDEVSKETLFLGESYLQVWERRGAARAVEAVAGAGGLALSTNTIRT